LITHELPQPPQSAGEIQTVSLSATVVAPSEMMLNQYDSLVRSSGNSFWFPFDKYDFRVSISALLPDSVEIMRKQGPNERIKEIPFGFCVYSYLNGFNVKAIPESDNVLHITLYRPARVIAIYGIPIVALLLLSIIISLKSHLDFFESNKGILAFLSLVLGLIPILLSLLFTPSGVQRPSLLDCIEYALVTMFIIVIVVAYRKHEARKEMPKGK
jgi:hypothetical protein